MAHFQSLQYINCLNPEISIRKIENQFLHITFQIFYSVYIHFIQYILVSGSAGVVVNNRKTRLSKKHLQKICS